MTSVAGWSSHTATSSCSARDYLHLGWTLEQVFVRPGGMSLRSYRANRMGSTQRKMLLATLLWQRHPLRWTILRQLMLRSPGRFDSFALEELKGGLLGV